MKDILVAKKDHVLAITLNRPESSNAYSEDMVKSFVAALKNADEDKDVRVVVITGAGKNFCAGGDVKAMKDKTGMFSGESNELRENYMDGIQQIPKTIMEMRKPIIAMVNGAAVGAGCDLAAMCDLRVASTSASFAETFAKVGLVPGDGGAYFLIRLIGFAKASEMFLTCQSYSALEALSMGLVNKVVSPETLHDEVMKLAQMMSSLPPIALQMTKKSLRDAYHSSLSNHLDLVSSYQGITQRSSDHFRALEAMVTKSLPKYEHN